MNDSMMQAWVDLSTKGMVSAVGGLSQMLGREISVSHIGTRRVALREAAGLFGGADAPTAAIYLGMSGDATGHMVLVYPPAIAFQLVDLALGDAPGTANSLAEMERSVLGEIGNVMGSSFLNTVADVTGVSIRVSPPAVMLDMAGAVLDAALADVMVHGDEAVVVEMTFGTPDHEVRGTFLVMPSEGLIRRVSTAGAA